MARSGVSISELTDVLKKSGLPFGDSEMMGQIAPFAKESIQQEVGSRETIIPERKKAYLDKIAKIAEMDKRLAGVYGDPSSKLFIENPMDRENALTGAEDVGFKELVGIERKIEERKQTVDDIVDEALGLYKSLTTLQKQGEKVVKGKKSTATKATTKEQKEIEKRRKELGLDVTDAARISDDEARDYFLTLPAKFQKEWIRKIQEGRLDIGGKIMLPKKGYSLENIKSEYDKYKKSTSTKSSTTSSSSGGGFRFTQ